MNIAITDLRGAAWNTHHAAKKDDPEFKGLVTSVKKQGIIQRVLVRKLSDGSYEIIDGHRRVEAAKAAVEAFAASTAAFAASSSSRMASIFSSIASSSSKS